MLSGPALGLGLQAASDGVVERVGDLVEVARLQAALDPVRVDLDAQRHAAVHRHRQRLGAAHAAESGGERDRARPASRRGGGGRSRRSTRRCPAGSPGCRCRSTSRRSSARTSSARAPRAGGTRPRWPSRGTRLELAISTRGAHSWVRNDADRLARLHQQRLVVAQRAQRADDRVEGLPGARRPAGAAVDDEMRRDPRPPRDRGCSSASASPPPAASPGRRARCRGARG